MRKRARIWLLVGGLVVLLLIGAGVWVYWAAREVPQWYQQAVAPKDRAAQQEASDEMEQRVAELASGIKTTGRWQVLVTERQINGWLATGLPKKHRDALPKGFTEPRVKIEPDGVWGACRVDRGTVSCIVSMKVDVYLPGPNVVAARIRRAQLGRLPWPLRKVLDGVSQSARRADVPLVWHQTEGDPVAVVRLPPVHGGKHVRIETVQLGEGKVYIAGVTRSVKP